MHCASIKPKPEPNLAPAADAKLCVERVNCSGVGSTASVCSAHCVGPSGCAFGGHARVRSHAVGHACVAFHTNMKMLPLSPMYSGVLCRGGAEARASRRRGKRVSPREKHIATRTNTHTHTPTNTHARTSLSIMLSHTAPPYTHTHNHHTAAPYCKHAFTRWRARHQRAGGQAGRRGGSGGGGGGGSGADVGVVWRPVPVLVRLWVAVEYYLGLPISLAVVIPAHARNDDHRTVPMITDQRL